MKTNSHARHPRVSVIMPFHNAAPTIVESVRSLMQQTIARDIEVVWVDDGSTDNGRALLQRELRSIGDSHFAHTQVLEHDFRKGSAIATDTGMRRATGDYLIRCDADDIIRPDGIEQMLRTADATDADVVWCGLTESRDGHERVIWPRHTASPLNDAPINTVQYSLCNKLMRRAVIERHNIYPYPGVNCWEDLSICVRLMALTDKIAYLNQAPYVYRINSNTTSLSRSHRDIVLRDHLRCAVLLEDWFVTQGLAERYEEFLTRLKFIAKVKYMRGHGKDVERWKATFPEVNRRILGIRYVGILYRLAFAAVAILPARFTQWICEITEGNRGQE